MIRQEELDFLKKKATVGIMLNRDKNEKKEQLAILESVLNKIICLTGFFNQYNIKKEVLTDESKNKNN